MQKRKKEIFSKDQKRLLEKVIQARKDARMTQVQVAKKLKVWQSYVSKIEGGEINLSALLLSRLAKLYGKKVDDFFN